MIRFKGVTTIRGLYTHEIIEMKDDFCSTNFIWTYSCGHCFEVKIRTNQSYLTLVFLEPVPSASAMESDDLLELLLSYDCPFTGKKRMAGAALQEEIPQQKFPRYLDLNIASDCSISSNETKSETFKIYTMWI